MRKLYVILLSFATVCGMLCMPASAADKPTPEEDIQGAVEIFLGNYSQKVMGEVDNDLTSCSVLDGSVPMPADMDTALFETSSGESTIFDLQKNISYVQEKAEFMASSNQMYDIHRTDLELTYYFEKIAISGNSASVTVSEVATFQYTDCTEPSLLETIYDVDLVCISGQWLIADVTDNEYFDAQYKNSGTFDAALALMELENGLDKSDASIPENPTEDQTDESGLELLSNAPYTVAYNRENAVAYAYTYTRENPPSDRDTFYNPLFQRFDKYGPIRGGGDCMNFASQCMWAGFYGSQFDIDSHKFPMDTDGQNKWYGTSRGASDYTSSWTSCGFFRDYIAGSNASDDVGMKAQVIDVKSGSAVSSADTTQWNLPGAVAHVPSDTSSYGHANVITNATGLARNQIYFSAHSTDAKNVKLADKYNQAAIKIFIPQYMRSAVPTNNVIRAKMLRPVAVGTTQTLSFSTSVIQSELTIQVTPVNGGSTLGRTERNQSTCFYQYRFSEEGMYRIVCTLGSGDPMVFYVLAYK